MSDSPPPSPRGINTEQALRILYMRAADPDIAALVRLVQQLTAQRDACMAALELIRTDVLTTEHREPCPGVWYGDKAPCRCGWPTIRAEVEAALARAKREGNE